MSPRLSSKSARWRVPLAGAVILGLGAVPAFSLPGLWEATAPVIAHLHPALVHFPIGLLVLAAVLDLTAALFGRKTRSPAARACLLWGTLGAAAAAGSGWIYADLEPPSRLLEETLRNHRWVGIAALSTAALSWLLYLMSRGGERSGPRRLSRVVLFACLVLVSLGGHLGGDMVYGEAYLEKPVEDLLAYLSGSDDGEQDVQRMGAGAAAGESLADPQAGSSATGVSSADGADGADGLGEDELMDALAANAGELLFTSTVLPIFEARCFDCHGPKKQKGGLRLDLADGGLFGDEEGTWSMVEPGSPEASTLIQRLTLPADDLDIMPAEGEPLTAEEIDAVSRWVSAGASWPQS
ncbi:MAG: putative membrane protein [Pseudohongiellaceae bacterium]|jgi:uncharacterized membrane protein